MDRFKIPSIFSTVLKREFSYTKMNAYINFIFLINHYYKYENSEKYIKANISKAIKQIYLNITVTEH